jgi:hydrogenase small subunit
MAITRRQFVTRLGALAAAAGFSQVEASKIMDAVAYSSASSDMGSVYQGTFGKPRVVWLHGAECTGCSTSVLGIYENTSGAAIYDANGNAAVTTGTALTLADTLPTTGEGGAGGLLLHDLVLSPDQSSGAVDIADVVIDVIDLLYHETVMGMGGDTAYQWLTDFSAHNAKPFVLVVEGASQLTGDGSTTGGGAWSDFNSTVPWCSIAHADATGGGDVRTGDMVATLGDSAYCVAIFAIGQCATFGGYPACRPPLDSTTAGFDTSKAQSGAMGTYDYLSTNGHPTAAAKVVNVPGCPTNPWWFVLSVVAAMVDLQSILIGNNLTGTLGILTTPTTGHHPALGDNPIVAMNAGSAASCGVDTTRRIKAVYGTSVHGPYCQRYRNFVRGEFAAYPGDSGCLQKIGCKGPAANSLCGMHGWNGQQPENPATTAWDYSVSTANTSPGGNKTGGFCTRAGHPCMACTEKGYPDNFVPFVVRS